ncbi:ATP-binding protein [Streptosporangium lutulentum]
MERRILAQDPELTPRVRVTTGESARLVGRKAETEALDLAVTGDGHRTVLLAGEPGIGKTSLAEHAAEAARSRGHRVVWGRCWDGTGAPPFWPWTQAVQELVGRDGELAQLAGAGQFELYEAFARLLNEHGRVLVVLDDLQWADASSLRLLEFLAATRLCPRLTVVATYRDTDVRQGGALEQALGVLLRLPNVRRLLLRGLAEGRSANTSAGQRRSRPGRRDGQADRRQPVLPGGGPATGRDPAALSDVVRGRMAAFRRRPGRC